MSTGRSIAIRVVVACCWLGAWAAGARAGIIYTESFNAASNDQTVATLNAYPGFYGMFVADGRAVVAGGQLRLAGWTANTDQLMLRPGVAGATISTLVGADNSNGNYNVGLRVGDNRIVFHPGAGGGLLRVEGTGGFGNTNVGFTPANGVLHRLDVTSNGAGVFNLTLTDGANPANVFTTSFTNPASEGGVIGMLRSGQAVGVGLYDNFTVNGVGQGFDTNTNVGTSEVYRAVLGGVGQASVAGDRLSLSGSGGPVSEQLFLRSGLKRDYTLIAHLGESNGDGNYSVGLEVGQNNIVFHPGFPGGALRVEGPGGFGNTDMGFTPASGVAHELKIHSDGLSHFDVTVIDGSNPANTFTRSFTNVGSVGGDIGPRRQGQNTGSAFFNDVSISIDRPGHQVRAAQLFDRNADTSLAYPGFLEEGGGEVFVSNGQLVLSGRNAGGTFLFSRPGPAGAATFSTLVGADNSGGNYNVGLQIGENNIVFHPGLAGGAFRVDGPGGFGNTNVGFTPANNVLHHLDVVSNGAGLFTVTLTDGSNPANTFTSTFTNPNSVGGRIGLFRSGPTIGDGIFDNFTVNGVVQPFNVSTDARALYPGFAATLNGGRAVVLNGVLQLEPLRGTDTFQSFLIPGYAGEFDLTGLVGADNSNGSYNVGLMVGQNNIVFHPGLAGGAFRIEGPGGIGNTDVGFTPANNVLHRLEVFGDGLGNFNVTLIDGSDPTKIFTTSFFNPGSVGGDVGFRRAGPDAGVGLFDELVLTAVPEPATIVTFLLAGSAVGVRAMRRRARS